MDVNSRLEASAGLIWLMMGAGGGFDVEPSYSIKFGQFYVLAEELVASQEGLLRVVR
jgi:hypothetical protein